VEADSIHFFVETLRNLARDATPGGTRPGRVAGSIPMSDDILGIDRARRADRSAASFVGVIAVWSFSSSRGRLGLPARSSSVCFGSWGHDGLDNQDQLFELRRLSHHFWNRRRLRRQRDESYVQDGRRDIKDAVRSTGGAVALCSLTTIIGLRVVAARKKPGPLPLRSGRGARRNGVPGGRGRLLCPHFWSASRRSSIGSVDTRMLL